MSEVKREPGCVRPRKPLQGLDLSEMGSYAGPGADT